MYSTVPGDPASIRPPLVPSQLGWPKTVGLALKGGRKLVGSSSIVLCAVVVCTVFGLSRLGVLFIKNTGTDSARQFCPATRSEGFQVLALESKQMSFP